MPKNMPLNKDEDIPYIPPPRRPAGVSSRLWGRLKCRYCDRPFDVVVAIVPKHEAIFMCNSCNDEYSSMIYGDRARRIEIDPEQI